MDYDRDDAVSLLRAAAHALRRSYGPAGPPVGDPDPEALTRLADQIGTGSLIGDPSRPASIEEERLALGWVQQFSIMVGGQGVFPEPMPNTRPAPGGAGMWAGTPVSGSPPGICFMRWLAPVEAPNG